jgi:lipoprotein NlpD
VKASSYFIRNSFTALAFAASVLLSGCVWLPLNSSPAASSNYNVSGMCEAKPGDSLYSIAAEHCTTVRELARVNRLKESAPLHPGMVLRIPSRQVSSDNIEENHFWKLPSIQLADAARLLGPSGSACPRTPTEVVPVCARNGGEEARGARAMDNGRLPVNFVAYQVCARTSDISRKGMSWPVIGRVSRPFSIETNHRGLDICAPEGTPILAAKSGKVVYSADKLRGFGNMIIIDHGGEFATIYAHNRRNLVKVGQVVRRGQKIAEVGQTGNATAPHCHFETRLKAKALDPRPMLP